MFTLLEFEITKRSGKTVSVPLDHFAQNHGMPSLAEMYSAWLCLVHSEQTTLLYANIKITLITTVIKTRKTKKNSLRHILK